MRSRTGLARTLKWDDFQLVLAVRRGGSLSGAARLLEVRHTTIGRRLDAIEKELGRPLFERGQSMLITTELGDEMVSHAERMESEAMRFKGKASTQSHTPYGLVRVATMPWIISDVIVPALPDCLATYPGIEVETIGDVRERSLNRWEAELALRFEPKPKIQEHCEPVGEVSYAVYAPAGVDADALPWIAFGEDVAGTAPARWVASKRRSDAPTPFRAHDAGFIRRAIRAGVGKGLIPELLGETDSSLVRLSTAQPELVRPVYVLMHEDMRHVTRITAMISWLRRLFAADGH